MTKLHALANMGQAIWLDFIQRSLMESGQLQALIDQGLRGMTSNPSIFDKAISKSGTIQDLAKLAAEGKAPKPSKRLWEGQSPRRRPAASGV